MDKVLFKQIVDFERNGVKGFIKTTLKNASKAMFLIMPLLACIMALLFIRRKQFYFMDHMIFSLHFHSAIFIFLSIGLIFKWFLQTDIVVLIAALVVPLYLYPSVKNTYGQSWGKSFLKYIIVLITYLVLLLAAFLGIILASMVWG